MKIVFNNLGTVNKNQIILIGDNGSTLAVYFSYETPIAYKLNSRFVVRKNDWSRTTGKLLNQLEPDKKKRINGEEFEKQLSDLLTYNILNNFD